MAQLNPNFEIDFSDINSYEQIQLINDAQLARENLLMHRAYRDPSDQEVIRNNYGSYTFVDFRPRIFRVKQGSSAANGTCGSGTLKSSKSGSHGSNNLLNNTNGSHHQNVVNLTFTEIEQADQDELSFDPENFLNLNKENSYSQNVSYEVEKFSELFERINIWLKLNKDWQAVSAETLFYDSSTQFNHLKSSVHMTHLAQNTRGIRLHLHPAKSRFSGPQKMGCINVVPRRLPEGEDGEGKYENLEQLLMRLNELILTKPIEGRILSVETITLPIINGHVNFECNYIPDSELNLLRQRTNCCLYPAAAKATPAQSEPTKSEQKLGTPEPEAAAGTQSAAFASPGKAISDIGGQQQNQQQHELQEQKHFLIDILRIYYEFGPKLCGLVNIIDYVPRFYAPTELGPSPAQQNSNQASWDELLVESPDQHHCRPSTPPSRASVHSSREELVESSTSLAANRHSCSSSTISSSSSIQQVGTTNQQLKSQEQQLHLFESRKQIASESLTRLVRRSLAWFEEESKQLSDRGLPFHLMSLNDNEKSRSRTNKKNPKENGANNREESNFLEDDELGLSGASTINDDLPAPFKVRLCNTQIHHKTLLKGELIRINPTNVLDVLQTGRMVHEPKGDLLAAYGQLSATCDNGAPLAAELSQPYDVKFVRLAYVMPILKTLDSVQAWAAELMAETKERQLRNELAHQLGSSDSERLNESPIGQLTYRLFAPCQLVNSSSCFAINPVNSSSPLARRGSVDLNGSGLSSDSAHPSTLFQLTIPTTTTTTITTSNPTNPALSSLPTLSPSSISLTSHASSLTNGGATGCTNHHSTTTSTSHAPSSSSLNSAFSPSKVTELGSSFKSSLGALFPTLLAGATDLLTGTNSTNSNSHSEQQQQTIADSFATFGRHSPLIGGALQQAALHSNSSNSNTSSSFTANEFESVEAIKKRMEIYVTTNQMKVVAGETLVVNLSSNISCLSSAIEQTIVRSPFSLVRPSTWVSVYVLYAAVDEPQLPCALLAQQRVRELTLISEETPTPACD